jgi:hypothetical protein
MLVNAGNISRNITTPELPTPAEKAPAHPIPEAHPVRRGLGIPETPVLRNAEEAAVVLPDFLKNPPLSPPAPRRNVRRWHMSAERSSPVVMILIVAIGTAVGCLGLYYLLLGITLVLK